MPCRSASCGGATTLQHVLEIRRRSGVDLAVAHLERHADQPLAERRTGYAFAGIRLIEGAVRGAQDVAAVLVEEAVLHPVETHRDVTALVHVGVMPALPVD